MSTCSVFAPNGFSSTPVKKSLSRAEGFHKLAPINLDVGVLSDDEDTFSLLSPIYHDSFDSVENVSRSSGLSSSKGGGSPVLSEKCELPKTRLDQMLIPAVPTTITSQLGAWELWLLNKAKEDQIKCEKKAEEELLLQEKKIQQEKEHEQKVAMINQRIQEWLKIKRKHEKEEQLLTQSKEQDAFNAQKEKQREIELKAQKKYREWLQKKNQEKAEKQKKEKEEAALKEEQKRERRRMAEDKFQEWLHQAKSKNISNAKSTCPGPHGKAYPSPSFYNPIPWKPIHIPSSEMAKTGSDRNAAREPKERRRLRPLPTVSRQKNTDRTRQKR